MRTEHIQSFLARHKSAARLLFIAFFAVCIALFLYHEGDYLWSLRRASLLIAPEDAPFVRSLPAAEEKIDINTATLEELETVSGIGPVTAQKILDLRTERNGFCFLEEVRDVSGVGEKRFEALAEQFYCPLPSGMP